MALTAPATRRCSIEGCVAPHRAAGLCNKHYLRRWHTGTTAPGRGAECASEGCMDRPRLFGLCREHYAVAADLRCSKCGETKPVGAFQNPSSDGTRHSWCISCRDASWKERYAANPALFRERSRWATVKNRYGITQEQYEEMLAAQNGVCAVCYQPERHKTRKRLSVDHDHATGRVRGLLCAGCNAAIGNFDEDPARMLAAVRYLEG